MAPDDGGWSECPVDAGKDWMALIETGYDWMAPVGAEWD